MSVRILIVDDHEIVRVGIRTLLNGARPQWEICGEATNGRDAIEAAKSLTPDVIILDVTMAGMSGLETAARMTSLGLSPKILIFTMHESVALIAEVRTSGARGYVAKSQASRDLVLAIESLLSGGTFFGASETQSGPGKSGFSIRGLAFFLAFLHLIPHRAYELFAQP